MNAEEETVEHCMDILEKAGYTFDTHGEQIVRAVFRIAFTKGELAGINGLGNKIRGIFRRQAT